MKILITNDDGISAQGIRVLAQAAVEFGSVTVIAPDRQCSAMSHRITLGRPLRLESVDFPVEGVTAYSLDGTPADCVKAALDAVLPEKPDVVLSGINHGYNVGFDVAYSGTVGAAMEALMNGIPAIALSQNDVGSFDVAREYLPQVLGELLPQAPSRREIWNVNFPTDGCRGLLRNRTVAAGGYYSGRLYRQEAENAAHLQYPPGTGRGQLHPPGRRNQRPERRHPPLHLHRPPALPGAVIGKGAIPLYTPKNAVKSKIVQIKFLSELRCILVHLCYNIRKRRLRVGGRKRPCPEPATKRS